MKKVPLHATNSGPNQMATKMLKTHGANAAAPESAKKDKTESLQTHDKRRDYDDHIVFHT